MSRPERRHPGSRSAGNRPGGPVRPPPPIAGPVPVGRRCCSPRRSWRRRNELISKRGPPTPLPMSATTIPGLRPSAWAMKCSWRARDALKLSPGTRGAKWNDLPQPNSKKVRDQVVVEIVDILVIARPVLGGAAFGRGESLFVFLDGRRRAGSLLSALPRVGDLECHRNLSRGYPVVASAASFKGASSSRRSRRMRFFEKTPISVPTTPPIEPVRVSRVTPSETSEMS